MSYGHLKILISQSVVQIRSTRPDLYFLKIMEFSHYNEYGVCGAHLPGVDFPNPKLEWN